MSDYRTFSPTDNHCVVVLGYKPGMAGIDDVLNRVKIKHVPLIVYTYGDNRIDEGDRTKFLTYPDAMFANFRLTLINSIFACVASYPYGRR